MRKYDMAAGKLRKTEIFINVLFWIAMTLSVAGLFIYGSYQIYRWRTDKGFHSFSVGAKKKKSTTDDSEPEESKASEQSDRSEKSVKSKPRKKLKKSHHSDLEEEKPGRPSALALDFEYIDQELKVVIEDYLRKQHYRNPYDSTWLVIDYTPTKFGLHTLMQESNHKAYEELMVKRGNFIMRILQVRHGEMKWNFNPTVRPPGFWQQIIISSAIPQSLLDYYSKLPKSPLYTWYPDELLDKIINFSAKPEDENENLIINLEPEELAGNTYYVYLNSFIKEANDPGFKQLAFEQLTDSLAKHLAAKYKVELMYDEENDQYYIPQEQRWQLEKNADLSALNPHFSALAAKRQADRAKALQDKNESKKTVTKDEEKQTPDEDSDSQSFGSK